MNLSGRTVLLTGATGGLGHAIARACAGRGAKLILTGRRAELLEPLAAEIGGRAIAADLADRDGLDPLLADAGDVDVLIANAALPASGPVDGFSDEDLDRALDVNLRSPIFMARRLMEPMKARGAGHLLFVSSLSGKSAAQGTAIYSATKFGLRGFAHGLREDLRPHGVGVSIVSPGFIRDAGMFHESGGKLPSYIGTKTPEDVAKAVLRAIESDKAELDVAPLGVRLGASFGSAAPGLAASVQRRLGAGKISESVSAGQRDKR